MSAGGIVLRDRAGARLAGLSARATLGALVAVSAVVRFSFALRRETITTLPDEYTYSQLARGLAETGHPVIRGGSAHFPALLEPLLAAPFWLAGDPQLAFRLTQLESAIAMSLAAIPLYLLARRLQLTVNLSLACAAAALVVPGLLYASYVTADPIAYPLALAAVYAGVVALDAPSRRAQAVFLLLACLATFARLQYAVLLPVLLVAAVLVHRRASLRAAGLVMAFVAAAAAAAAVAGTSAVLGRYESLIHLHASADALLHQLGRDAVLLPFSAGIVLVPGALVGLGRALRSASATERAFASLTCLLGCGLLGEAVVVGVESSGNYIGRYLIVLPPLLVPAFCLWARRGGALRAVSALAAGLAALVLAVRVPGDAAGAHWTDSPFLYAVTHLVAAAGTTNGGLVVSAVAAALAAAACLIALHPAPGAAVGLLLFFGVSVAVSAGATSWDLRGSHAAYSGSFSRGARWVDAVRPQPVTFVATPGADRGDAEEQMFWNTSVDRAVLLPGGPKLDGYAQPAVSVGADGTLVAAGRPVVGPLLVDELQTWVRFAGSPVQLTSGIYDLVGIRGPARLELEAVGLLRNGWLARSGSITVWPHARDVRLTLRLSLPRELATSPNAIVFRGGRSRQTLRVEPGGSGVVALVFPAHRRSSVVFRAAHSLGVESGVPVAFAVEAVPAADRDATGA